MNNEITESRDWQSAVSQLRSGEPVPLDVQMRLLAEGVDYSALEETYGA